MVGEEEGEGEIAFKNMSFALTCTFMWRAAADDTILKGAMSSSGSLFDIEAFIRDTSSLKHSARHARIASGLKGVEVRATDA